MCSNDCELTCCKYQAYFGLHQFQRQIEAGYLHVLSFPAVTDLCWLFLRHVLSFNISVSTPLPVKTIVFGFFPFVVCMYYCMLKQRTFKVGTTVILRWICQSNVRTYEKMEMSLIHEQIGPRWGYSKILFNSVMSCLCYVLFVRGWARSAI